MNKLCFGFVFLWSFLCIQPAVAKSWQEIKQSGELRIGVPGDYAPLAFHNKQGNLVGFDIDMAQALSKDLQLNVSFVLSSWPTLSDDLAADKFDIAMGGVTETPGRKARFALSAPVVKNGKIALTQCDKVKTFNSLAAIDRKGVRVIVNPGGTNQAYVDKTIKHAQIIRTKDNFANLQGIRDRQADIMFTDLIEGDYYQNKEPGTLCVATPETLPGTASYKVYMMNKDKPDLLNAVNNWLAGDSKTRLINRWQLSE